MANYRVIGKPVERVDGPEMLTGQAVYGPDVKLPGMLWGKILRSPIPHGKVLRVDVEKARNHPGVKAVIAATPSKTSISLRSKRCDLSVNRSPPWRRSMRTQRKKRSR